MELFLRLLSVANALTKGWNSKEARECIEELQNTAKSEMQNAKNFARVIFSAAVWTSVISGTSIVVAAFLGGIPYVKEVVIGLVLVGAILNTLWIFLRVLPPGVGLAIIFRVARAGNQEAIAEIPTDLKQALRALSWTLASVFVIGIVAWLVPFHSRPLYIIPFSAACLATMFWALYESKGIWWPRILGTVSVGTVIVLLISFFVSYEEASGSKFWLLRVIAGHATGQEIFWFMIVALIASILAFSFIPKEYKGVKGAVGLGIPILALAVFLHWGIWGPEKSEQPGHVQVGKMPETKKEEPQILSGDTVKLPYGQDFVLNRGAKKMTFIFKPEGFCLVNGSAVIESASPVQHVDGVAATERLMSAETYAQKHGGPPCFGSKWNSQTGFVGMPFSYTLSAPAGDAVIVAAKEGQHFGPDEGRR